mmetsp:Transcript_5962/g.15692  ORF Transcript_5962/g.15692 Transcript_5962/m.15692 type:complete len:217 (+) Transcript_5962:1642-2292(+)
MLQNHDPSGSLRRYPAIACRSSYNGHQTLQSPQRALWTLRQNRSAYPIWQAYSSESLAPSHIRHLRTWGSKLAVAQFPGHMCEESKQVCSGREVSRAQYVRHIGSHPRSSLAPHHHHLGLLDRQRRPEQRLANEGTHPGQHFRYALQPCSSLSASRGPRRPSWAHLPDLQQRSSNLNTALSPGKSSWRSRLLHSPCRHTRDLHQAMRLQLFYAYSP